MKGTTQKNKINKTTASVDEKRGLRSLISNVTSFTKLFVKLGTDETTAKTRPIRIKASATFPRSKNIETISIRTDNPFIYSLSTSLININKITL